MRSARSRGFTLIEALAAVVLVTVGLVATLRCLGAMGESQARATEREEMQRLAFRKYDEILATSTLTSGKSEGDFESIGEKRFTWSATMTPVGDGNLESLVVDVLRRGSDIKHGVEIEGLWCPKNTSQGGS